MDQVKIGKFIAHLRRQNGWTQEQLGEKLGVTNKTISRWETGKYMPDIDKLPELSALFGISINELLAGKPLADPAGFRKKADENLISILTEESAFGLQERITYFKRKWRRDHKALIAFWISVWIILCLTGLFTRQVLLLAFLPIAGLLIYGYLRNQMMIYVEQRAFRSDAPK